MKHLLHTIILGSALASFIPFLSCKPAVPPISVSEDGTPLPRTGSTTPAGWTDDLDAALEAARTNNKLVYVLFTGSDWCGWCKKLKSETLTQREFMELAARHLVLVYLDMPNNGVSQQQIAKNEKTMMEICNEGGVPTAVILDANKRLLGKLSGYSPKSDYLSQIKDILAKNGHK